VCEKWCPQTTWVTTFVTFFVILIAALGVGYYVQSSVIGQHNLLEYDLLGSKPGWLPNSNAFLSMYLTGALFLAIAGAGIMWYHDCFVKKCCCDSWDALVFLAGFFTILYIIFPVVAFISDSWPVATAIGFLALLFGFGALWLFREFEFFFAALVVPVLLAVIMTFGALYLATQGPVVNIAYNM
jgi:hypothetical protein